MTQPLIIDSFAGGGGASTGIERALGRSPDVAINHNAAALALHAANHPETLHLSNDIWNVDPVEVAAGRPVGLLWASPDCKHFSKAKGGAPRDRNIRDLAWVVVDWAEKVRPDVILMENVEEFKTWGPVDEDGRPVREFEGVTFELWIKRLRKAGYRVAWKELRACDFGAPTIRKRFFMVARRDGRPIVWPKASHGDPDSLSVKRGHRLPWRTAADCIDWSLPCPSIFDDKATIKAKHNLTAVRPLANNTMARIARGLKRYVLDSADPFIVNLTHGARLEDTARPFNTITGANRGEKAIVNPHITRFNGGATGQPLSDPLATVTANSFIKRPGGAAPLGLIAPMMTHLYTSNTAGGDGQVDRPVKTVTAGGQHHALVAPVLTYAQQGGGNRDMRDPHHTICASSKDQNMMLAPVLVQSGYGEAQGQAPRCLDVGAPLGTVVAGGIKHAVATPFLAQHNSARDGGINPGRAADAPLSTIIASGSHQNAVLPWIAKYYGTGDGARSDEPMHTVTVRDRMGHVEASAGLPPFTTEQADRAREVAAFLRAHDAWDHREFVTVKVQGTTCVIVDIGMRMLTPRELFNAQGFPPDYVIEGVWNDDGGDWTWHPFTKSTQVSCCGNSVCPDLAQALVAANCAHLASGTADDWSDELVKAKGEK
ncbi:DNA cytosine methyltransferase [Loktanella sp. 3ANDIMAR09]|uniref:DNA cytosine methyltransferase n=1 Tax=Loktanella sp. 3ANDIMAR09 TaxID=1225657 RepID=UPI0006F8BFF5|nr:DNA cytosine methyltransferase [Loktanella sp. 3ANDIMAR09]